MKDSLYDDYEEEMEEISEIETELPNDYYEEDSGELREMEVEALERMIEEPDEEEVPENPFVPTYSEEVEVLDPFKPTVKTEFRKPEGEEDTSEDFPEYKKKWRDTDSEEGSLWEDIKEEIYNSSPASIARKAVVIFLLSLYAMWASIMMALSTLFNFEGVYNPFALGHRLITRHPLWAIIGIILALFITLVFSIFIYRITKKYEGGYKMSGNTTYGDLREATEEDLKGALKFEPLDRPTGIVIGMTKDEKYAITIDPALRGNLNGLWVGAPGCVDRETEFFNGSEWKSIADYKEGEKVLQFNPETNEASLVTPERYIKAPCDKMYHFETKYGINQTLSEEHRVLYYKRDTHNGGIQPGVHEISAKELMEKQNAGLFRGKFKTDFIYDGGGIPLSDIEIKVMLAVICDGTFEKDKPNSKRCVLNIKKARKKNEIFKILREYANEEFFVNEKDDGYTRYSFQAPRREKEFEPYWYSCNQKQLKLICENILKWDGTTDETGRKAFSTTSKVNADFVQFAFSACGYRAKVRAKDRQGEPFMTNGQEYVRKHTEYTITISDTTYVGMDWKNDGRKNNVVLNETKPVDGMKYCFTVPTHALVLRRDGNIFITGNSGKTFSGMNPNILRAIDQMESGIFTDPSGKSYELFERLAKKTHIVKVINLKKLECSDALDMFSAIKAAKGTNEEFTEIQNFVNTLMSNAAKEGSKSDSYFDNIEALLLSTLVRYVAIDDEFKGKDYERHIGTVYDILDAIMQNGGVFPPFDVLPNTNKTKREWMRFTGGFNANQKSSAMTGLLGKIQIFQDDMVQEIFSHNEIDLSLPGKEPCIYFVISQVETDTYRFILSLFFSSLLQSLIRTADDNGGTLDVPVNIFLDEFKSIGIINGFTDKLANVRKYGIRLHPIIQDINQLDTNYRGQRDSIISNCDTLVVLGANDNTTAKILSDKMGTMTILNESTRRKKPRFNPLYIVTEEQVSVSDGKRAFLNPDEIQRLRKDGLILIITNGRYPLLAKPYGYTNHYLAEYADNPKNQHRADQHIPDWQEADKTADKYHTFRDPSVVNIGSQEKKKAEEKINAYTEEPKKKDSNKKVLARPDSKILDSSMF